jgi:hypothetical protein
VKNGELLTLAVNNNFTAFVTVDKNLQFQQNIEKYPLSIVVFDLVRLDLENIVLLLPKFKAMASNFEKHKIYLIG